MGTVIGVAGSPRRRGNSSTLMASALAGAASVGADTKVVNLNDLTFKGCQGCTKCSSAGRCVLNDDLTPVLEELRDADGWILASPIYFDSVSGQMKTFFDRCHTFVIDPLEQKTRPQLAGVRRAMIILAYEDSPRDEYRHEGEKLADYLGWMGDFGTVEIVSEGLLGSGDAARSRPDLLQRVQHLGSQVFG